MSEAANDCPQCGSAEVQQYIYGYPTPEEIDRVDFGTAILAGPMAYLQGMPTHRCAACGQEWLIDEEIPTEVEPRRECHFCDTELSPSDVLRHEIAVDEYHDRLEASDDTLSIEREAFAYHPLPICQACREGIDQLDQELEIEQRVSDQQTVWTSRVLGASCLLVVVLFVFMAIMLYVSEAE